MYHHHHHPPIKNQVKDKLKVQIDFGRNITFTFGDGKHLCGKENMSPVIYTLNLELIMTDDAQLYVERNQQFKSIGEYRLNIAYTGLISRHFEEKRDLGHSLSAHLEKEHLFLFDIHFHSYYGLHLPGEDTGLFGDLCLFTCYVLSSKENNNDLFNILVEQFQITMSIRENDTFSRRDFEDFFDKCVTYLQSTSSNDSLALKIIIRMMALVTPMTKDNFDRNCSLAMEFTNKIIRQIRTNFYQVVELVKESEWSLFKNGLALLCVLELLYQEHDQSNGNKLDFLHQISDEKSREDIANGILLQLSSLEQPINGNSKWTDLFTMVDPQILKIDHLNLAASFETLIQCISKISGVLEEGQLANAAFYDYLSIDLNTILYLLKFLDDEPSNECTATQHLLIVIQSTIRTSVSLKAKIEEYLNQLELIVQDMEEIHLIICSISKCPILSYIDKYRYLFRSLLNPQTISYYIKWCDDQDLPPFIRKFAC